MDLVAELAALRGGAAVTRAEDRVLLRVCGADRSRFLQGMLSNDVALLPPGRAAYALLLTEQGRIVGELRVLALADAVLLDAARSRAEAVRATLERFIVADDVEIERRREVPVAVRGPKARSMVAATLGTELLDLQEMEHTALADGAEELRVLRLRDFGPEGFLVWTPGAASADRLWRRLCAAGGVLVSDAAVDTVRIAAGIGREGVDFDERTLAPEVPSLARSISYRKGCYLGQEVVERVAARGHVNWLLSRLAGEGPAPAPGAPVRRDGAEVGHVTSSARDGTGFVALARIRRTAAERGATVEVGDGADPVCARIGDPPAV